MEKEKQPAFNSQFSRRSMPAGKIRSTKEQRGTDGLPLFDPKIKHEEKQEKAQTSLF